MPNGFLQGEWERAFMAVELLVNSIVLLPSLQLRAVYLWPGVRRPEYGRHLASDPDPQRVVGWGHLGTLCPGNLLQNGQYNGEFKSNKRLLKDFRN